MSEIGNGSPPDLDKRVKFNKLDRLTDRNKHKIAQRVTRYEFNDSRSILKPETELPLHMDTVIFGLAGNPPTEAHLHTALTILEKLNPGELEVLPSASHPTKKGLPFLAERIALLKEMVRELPKQLQDKIKVRLTEIFLSGYSIDTVRNHQIPKNGQERSIGLVVGADNLVTFNKWKEWQAILQKSALIVILREPYATRTQLEAALPSPLRNYLLLNPDKVKGIYVLEDHPDALEHRYTEMSSTKVRAQLAQVKVSEDGEPNPQVFGLTEVVLKYILDPKHRKLARYYGVQGV